MWFTEDTDESFGEKLDIILKRIHETESNDKKHECQTEGHTYWRKRDHYGYELVGLPCHEGQTQTHHYTHDIQRDGSNTV